MLLAADDPDRALSVNLDLSEAEPARVSEARSSGGRRRFYEAAIQALPRDLFDELDFDFIFPRHES
jgi:hypothetical protein